MELRVAETVCVGKTKQTSAGRAEPGASGGRADDQPRETDDPILDLAIEYVVNGAYLTGISKEKRL